MLQQRMRLLLLLFCVNLLLFQCRVGGQTDDANVSDVSAESAPSHATQRLKLIETTIRIVEVVDDTEDDATTSTSNTSATAALDSHPVSYATVERKVENVQNFRALFNWKCLERWFNVTVRRGRARMPKQMVVRIVDILKGVPKSGSALEQLRLCEERPVDTEVRIVQVTRKNGNGEASTTTVATIDSDTMPPTAENTTPMVLGDELATTTAGPEMTSDASIPTTAVPMTTVAAALETTTFSPSDTATDMYRLDGDNELNTDGTTPKMVTGKSFQLPKAFSSMRGSSDLEKNAEGEQLATTMSSVEVETTTSADRMLTTLSDIALEMTTMRPETDELAVDATMPGDFNETISQESTTTSSSDDKIEMSQVEATTPMTLTTLMDGEANSPMNREDVSEMTTEMPVQTTTNSMPENEFEVTTMSSAGAPTEQEMAATTTMSPIDSTTTAESTTTKATSTKITFQSDDEDDEAEEETFNGTESPVNSAQQSTESPLQLQVVTLNDLTDIKLDDTTTEMTPGLRAIDGTTSVPGELTTLQPVDNSTMLAQSDIETTTTAPQTEVPSPSVTESTTENPLLLSEITTIPSESESQTTIATHTANSDMQTDTGQQATTELAISTTASSVLEPVTTEMPMAAMQRTISSIEFGKPEFPNTTTPPSEPFLPQEVETNAPLESSDTASSPVPSQMETTTLGPMETTTPTFDGTTTTLRSTVDISQSRSIEATFTRFDGILRPSPDSKNTLKIRYKSATLNAGDQNLFELLYTIFLLNRFEKHAQNKTGKAIRKIRIKVVEISEETPATAETETITVMPAEAAQVMMGNVSEGTTMSSEMTPTIVNMYYTEDLAIGQPAEGGQSYFATKPLEVKLRITGIVNENKTENGNIRTKSTRIEPIELTLKLDFDAASGTENQEDRVQLADLLSKPLDARLRIGERLEHNNEQFREALRRLQVVDSEAKAAETAEVITGKPIADGQKFIGDSNVLDLEGHIIEPRTLEKTTTESPQMNFDTTASMMTPDSGEVLDDAESQLIVVESTTAAIEAQEKHSPPTEPTVTVREGSTTLSSRTQLHTTSPPQAPTKPESTTAPKPASTRSTTTARPQPQPVYTSTTPTTSSTTTIKPQISLGSIFSSSGSKPMKDSSGLAEPENEHFESANSELDSAKPTPKLNNDYVDNQLESRALNSAEPTEFQLTVILILLICLVIALLCALLFCCIVSNRPSEGTLSDVEDPLSSPSSKHVKWFDLENDGTVSSSSSSRDSMA